MMTLEWVGQRVVTDWWERASQREQIARSAKRGFVIFAIIASWVAFSALAYNWHGLPQSIAQRLSFEKKRALDFKVECADLVKKDPTLLSGPCRPEAVMAIVEFAKASSSESLGWKRLSDRTPDWQKQREEREDRMKRILMQPSTLEATKYSMQRFLQVGFTGSGLPFTVGFLAALAAFSAWTASGTLREGNLEFAKRMGGNIAKKLVVVWWTMAKISCAVVFGFLIFVFSKAFGGMLSGSNRNEN